MNEGMVPPHPPVFSGSPPNNGSCIVAPDVFDADVTVLYFAADRNADILSVNWVDGGRPLSMA